MRNLETNVNSSSIRLLDRFYRIFLFVAIVFLTVGAPFVFQRKLASAAAALVMLVAVLLAWRMSHGGQPKKSLIFFATGLWLVLVVLLYAGLPPGTTGTVIAMAVMLVVVVNLRTGVIFAVSYLLAWLLYIGLQKAHLAPEAYFPGTPMTGWFIGAIAIWLVLLPIHELVRNLRRSASLQRAVIEAATDGILVVNTAGKQEAYNQRFVNIWHIPAEYLGTHDDTGLLKFVSCQLVEPAQFFQQVQALYAHPDQSSFDTLLFKDGRVIERYSQPQLLDKEIVGRVWIFRDVTERERTQAVLRHRKDQFEAILNATTESIFLVDRDGTILSINDTAAHRLNSTPQQLLGRCAFDLFSPELSATRRATLEEVFRTGVLRYVEDMRAGRSFALNYYPVVGDDQVVESVVVLASEITSRKRADAQLIARESRLSSLIASMQDTVVVLDAQACVLEYFLPQGASQPPFQSPDGVVVGKTCHELLPVATAPLFVAAIAALLVDEQPQTFDYSVEDAGQTYFFLVTMSHVSGSSQDSGEFLTVVRDNTARRQARREIEQLAQRNKLLLDSVGEGIFDVDAAGHTSFTNPAALAMLGLTESQILGQHPHALFHHHREDGRPYPHQECPIYAVLQDGQRRRLESEWFWRQDGTGFPVSMIVTPVVEDDQRVGAVVVFQDITERKRSEAEIQRLAFHDALTLLPNRRLLNDRLMQMLATCKRSAQYGALLFLDLDNFKPLNDTYGHGVGDLLLVEVARRITSCVREIDTVARFGGDEFVVMLDELDSDLDAARQNAAQVAEKIRLALAQPYQLTVALRDGPDMQVQHSCTSSIGIAMFPEQAGSAAEVLKRADLAMYCAKAAGRNAFSFYQPGLA
jgi:diguanylate cyclase (GGDEF)-like protein/PAS domain S-box-containing protein